MTVMDVVRTSGMQRNAFYYHYKNLGELAEAAIRAYEPERIASIVMAAIRSEENLFENVAATHGKDFIDERIALIAGPHGSMDLLMIVKGIIWDLWKNMLYVDDSKRLVFEYAMGGAFSAMSYLASLPPEERMRAIKDSGVQSVIAKAISEALPKG